MTHSFEIVLKVGAEDGSVTLLRWETSPEKWRWAIETNEVLIYDLLEGEDGFDSRDAIKRKFAYSFEDALKLLNHYPWPKLYPMNVHPDYRDAILTAVLDRGGIEAEKRWRMLIQSSR